MKKHSQFERFKFAVAGIKAAWRQEASFRTEVWLFSLLLLHLSWKRPSAFWCTAVLTVSFAVLAAELVNTAIENVCDALHPEPNRLIGTAKDCAAAAVLVTCTGALIIISLCLWQTW